mgnify:CR=1 FL=1
MVKEDSNKKVLIIDDEESVLEMLSSFFQLNGYKVDTATDDLSGIRKFREDPRGVVITDLFMAGRGGFGVIRDLTKEYPNIKIIAMSGGFKPFWLHNNARKHQALKYAKEFGATKTFSKPVNLDQLLAAADALVKDLGDCELSETSA